MIAFVFPGVMILLVESTKRYPPAGSISSVLQEGLTILGRTALRRPGEMLLDERHPFKRDAKLFGKLEQAEVQVNAEAKGRVECQVNAALERAEKRLPALSKLHLNVQDVFNEYGVQIMSPRYIADPPRPVVVPKDQWYAAPSVNHEDRGMSQGGARESSNSVGVEK